MSRLWIGLAVVLWLGTYALEADEPGKVPRRFPPAVTGSAGRPTDAGPAAGDSSAELRAPAQLAAQPLLVASERGGQRRPTRCVLRLRNAPAMQLAQTMTNLFNAEQRPGRAAGASNVVIVPDVVSNCLIVGGPTETVDEVKKMVEMLDSAPVMIRLEVVLGDVPMANVPAAKASGKVDPANIQASTAGAGELRKQMEVLFRAQLTTLDNQPASLQMGRCEPTISSVNMSQMGRTNSVTMQTVGTMLKLTPRANAEGVVTMQLDIEDSRLGPTDEGPAIFTPDKGEPIRAPITESLTVQSTVKIADGQTVVLSGMARQPKNGKQRVILVTPHVLPIGGAVKQAK
jgi:type II secretory pathway component GspD/PulD (secretin)